MTEPHRSKWVKNMITREELGWGGKQTPTCRAYKKKIVFHRIGHGRSTKPLEKGGAQRGNSQPTRQKTEWERRLNAMEWDLITRPMSRAGKLLIIREGLRVKAWQKEKRSSD